jgi:hypothetical protein
MRRNSQGREGASGQPCFYQAKHRVLQAINSVMRRGRLQDLCDRDSVNSPDRRFVAMAISTLGQCDHPAKKVFAPNLCGHGKRPTHTKGDAPSSLFNSSLSSQSERKWYSKPAEKASPGAGLVFGVGERQSCKWETIFGF